MNKLTVKEEKFPFALAPSTDETNDVFDIWRKAGLEPVEISERDAIQSISIANNFVTGSLEWESRGKRFDGIQVMNIMIEALYAMHKHFFKEAPTSRLTNGTATFAASLDGDKITIGINPVHDPAIVKGLLVRALFEIIERSKKDTREELRSLFVVDGLEE